MLMRLHHVQITIPRGREEEARAFYCGVLGLKEIAKPGSLQGRGGFWVKLGDIEIHIGSEEDVYRRATKAHVAYEVSGIGEWRRTLNTRGVEIIECVAIPGYERFEFRDPFGNRVEMLESTP